MDVQIAASILSADFANLGADVTRALNAGVHCVHFDVMDHHYVPNLTVGAMVCQSLRRYGIKATIDVHLMVTHPEQYIEPFAQAGASILSFHPETVVDVGATVKKINDAGMQAGLVFNPDQPVVIDDAVLSHISMLLLMTVYPGFGGQGFIPAVLDKIKSTRAWLTERDASQVTLAVDGGVNVRTIQAAAQAGARYFVVGSGLFKAESYSSRVRELLAQIP